jgi:hypothetical protein
MEDHEIRDAFPHSHPLQTRPARTEDFSGFRMNPLGAFFTGRRVKKHHTFLPKLPKMLDQRGMGDEFLVRVASLQFSPAWAGSRVDQPVDRRFGEQSGEGRRHRVCDQLFDFVDQRGRTFEHEFIVHACEQLCV